MPLLDFYGQFATTGVTCGTCKWTGLGSELTSGETFGDGVEKHCPRCGSYHGFVQWSVVVSDNPPPAWKAKIPRVEF
jgi:hypothetical protein